MLSTKEFADWAARVVLFVHVTSRVDGEPYPNLLREKGGNGFPTVSFLDADGNLLKQVGNVTPLEDIAAAWDDLQTWHKLRAAVAGGATDKERELFLLEVAMGNRPYAELQERFGKLEFAADERARIEQQLVNLQFVELLRQTPMEKLADAGAQFLAMFRAGRIPDNAQQTSFWQYMFAHAALQEDVPLFEELLAYLEREKQDDPRLQRYLPQLQRQLEQLKQRKGK